MIRFIIDTTSRKTDTNGNRYHFATITSTKTGKCLRLDSVGGDSNAWHLIRRLIDIDFSEIHSTNQTVMIRDFNRMVKFRTGGKYEHQVIAADLLNLEEE